MGWKTQEMETQELAAHLEREGVSREPRGQTPLKASPEGQEQIQGHNKEAAGAPRRYTWVTMPSSKGSSQPRDPTHVSCIANRRFTV